MKFYVEINGLQVPISVDNAVDGARLIRELANSDPSISPQVVQETSKKQTIRHDDDVFQDVLRDEHPGSVESVLSSLRGTRTAKFLCILASMDGHGGLDNAIKSKMSEDGDINLAPYVSSISKACKREGVDTDSVLRRKTKRLRAGKIIYHYQLTKEAVAFINSFSDFELEEAFGDDVEALFADD